MNTFSSPHHRRKRPPAGRATHTHRPHPTTAPRESDHASSGLWRTVNGALFALPVTVVLGAIFLCVLAIVAHASSDPDAMLTPLAMCALGLASLMGGLVGERRSSAHPAAVGAVGGVMLVVLLWFVSLFFGRSAREALSMGASPLVGIALRVGVIVMEIIGAYLGTYRPRARARHSTRRR